VKLQMNGWRRAASIRMKLVGGQKDGLGSVRRLDSKTADQSVEARGQPLEAWLLGPQSPGSVPVFQSARLSRPVVSS